MSADPNELQHETEVAIRSIASDRSIDRLVGEFVSNLPGIASVLFCIISLGIIIFPVFARVRNYSGPGCLGILRRLPYDLQMYAQDYDERLPLASSWADQVVSRSGQHDASESSRHWILGCPYVKRSQPEIYGHAFNSILSEQNVEVVEMPEKTILLCDSDLPGQNPNAPGRSALADPPRHVNYNQAVSLDGHLLRITPDGQSHVMKTTRQLIPVRTSRSNHKSKKSLSSSN